MRCKDGHVYSDNLSLSVVSLNRISKATLEDKESEIDIWASLFKAKTWEEIKMLAQQNEYVNLAAQSMYSSVTDPDILALCMKRQEDIAGEERRIRRLAEQDKQIEEQDRQLAEQDRQLAEQNRQIAAQNRQLSEKNDEISEMKRKIEFLETQLSELKEIMTKQ